MACANQGITDALKTGREGLALSQRSLGERVGLPQSHISKIEGGAVDLKLSSLIELARALELDVVLVPRKSLLAVEAIMNAHPARDAASDRHAMKELRMLQKEALALATLHPDVSPIRRLRDLARGFINVRLGPADVARVTEVRRILKRIRAGKAPLDGAAPVADDLAEMRNRLVHPIDEPSAQWPAYRLDDGEPNA